MSAYQCIFGLVSQPSSACANACLVDGSWRPTIAMGRDDAAAGLDSDRYVSLSTLANFGRSTGLPLRKKNCRSVAARPEAHRCLGHVPAQGRRQQQADSRRLVNLAQARCRHTAYPLIRSSPWSKTALASNGSIASSARLLRMLTMVFCNLPEPCVDTTVLRPPLPACAARRQPASARIVMGIIMRLAADTSQQCLEYAIEGT